MTRLSFHAILVALAASHSFATQFVTRDTLPSDSLSPSCVNALVSNVACPRQVNGLGIDSYASVGALEEACTETCRTALKKYENSVSGACKKSDVYKPDGTREVPVSFFPALISYNFNKVCLRDDGRWCHRYAYKMSSENATDINLCDDCYIRQQQFMASSPLYNGYALRSNYSALTSSCSKTGFPLATATQNYSMPTQPTPTGSATPTPSCEGKTYQIKSGDTCQSISKSEGIGTAWLLTDNGLKAFCADFPSEGELCIKSTCTTHTLQGNETCKGIAQANVMTQTQLLTWNAILGNSCQNIELSVGDEICISPPGDDVYERPTRSAKTPSSSTATPTAVPAPLNRANGTTLRCSEYYEVKEGDYCNRILLKFSISQEDFLFLNEGINKNCTNLSESTSYCVRPVGPIDSYPGHPGYMEPLPTGDMESWSSLPTATSRPNSTFPTTAPIAPETRKDCHLYADGKDYQSDVTGTFYFSACEMLAKSWGISQSTLQNWNPSLQTNSSECALSPKYRYCREYYERPDSSGTPSSSATPTRSPTISPTPTGLPIRNGTIADCKKYLAVKPPMTCEDVLEDNDLTVSQFYAWNPAVGSECENLWPNYRYCIAGPTGTGPSVPGPTQSGIPENCDKYHVVEDGDTCPSVAEEYEITLDEFYKWNPAIKDKCAEGFWKENAYCVGVSG